MIVKQTNKLHSELDFPATREILANAPQRKELSGQIIASPYHVYCVETLREQHALRIGDTVEADLFVFGKGEPENPSWTKVGGRPFWPSDRPWPTTPEGAPYYFLAQFNFADSMDIIDRDLPGQVLLLLTDSVDDWLWGDEGLSFHWAPGDITPAADLNPPSTFGSSGPFYGVLHRSADYPEAEKVARELDVGENYNLHSFNGTKIGGSPNFIQEGLETEAAFLCQLGSIQAAPNTPYPWTNQEAPLSLAFDNSGIYGDGNCAVLGDMGSIYIFIDKQGNVTRHFECY